MIFFDESETQVHTSGYPRGGVDIPIAYENRIRVDIGSRGLRRQELAVFPVRRGLLSVEQTRLRKQQCSGANGSNAPRLARDIAKPLQHIVAYVAALDRVASRDQESVDGTL